MARIPFVSSAIKRFGKARKAFKSGQIAKGVYEGSSGVADVVFPAWIGKEVHDSYKGQKMVGKELNRLHKQAGFLKEASAISGGLRLGRDVIGGISKNTAKRVVGGGAKPGLLKKTTSAIWRNKKPIAIAAGGAAAGATGVLGAQAVSKAVNEKKTYGPQYRYGGQFR